MSKYYKAEDVLAIFSEEERPLNWTDSESEIQAQNDFDCYKGMIESLPTIEVSEEVLKATKKFNAYTIADENAEMGMRTMIEPVIEVSEDCISREDTIKIIERIKTEVSDSKKPQPMPITICNWFLADIKNAPSVVPTTEQCSLVHCKDCKYFMDNVAEDNADDECRWRTDEMPNADDYCSYGEKK